MSDGGKVIGKSHEEGGEKFDIEGRLIELEGEEGVINKRSMKSKKEYIVKGNPSKIASCINELEGGVKFEEGECDIHEMKNNPENKEKTISEELKSLIGREFKIITTGKTRRSKLKNFKFLDDIFTELYFEDNTKVFLDQHDESTLLSRGSASTEKDYIEIIMKEGGVIRPIKNLKDFKRYVLEDLKLNSSSKDFKEDSKSYYAKIDGSFDKGNFTEFVSMGETGFSEVRLSKKDFDNCCVLEAHLEEGYKEGGKVETKNKYIVKYSEPNKSYQIWIGDEIIEDYSTENMADKEAKRLNLLSRERGLISVDYDNMSAEDVWELWNESQREHFLLDHKKPYTKNLWMRYWDYEELPDLVKKEIDTHILTGRYKYGGKAYKEGGKVLKITKKRKFYHARFENPSKYEDYATPDWAEKAASSVVMGAEVGMGYDEDTKSWEIQKVMIPVESGSPLKRITEKKAEKYATEIYNKINNKKECGGKIYMDGGKIKKKLDEHGKKYQKEFKELMEMDSRTDEYLHKKADLEKLSVEMDALEAEITKGERAENEYKRLGFVEGDDYWTIENGEVIHSVYDDVTEELIEEGTASFPYITEENAIESLPKINQPSLTQSIMFMNNVKTDFIEETWKGDEHIIDHLNDKLDGYVVQSKKDTGRGFRTREVMARFITELDDKNRLLLGNYIIKNH